MTKTKHIYFGNTWFLPPFRVMGYWVEDSAGKSVAQTADIQLARALADMLNKKEAK
jgi:hypothetical protein